MNEFHNNSIYKLYTFAIQTSYICYNYIFIKLFYYIFNNIYICISYNIIYL